MKKVIGLVGALIIICTMTAFSMWFIGCSYSEYNVSVEAPEGFTVMYDFNNEIPIYKIITEEEVLAEIIFTSGKADGVKIRENKEVYFQLMIHEKYNKENLKVIVNENTIEPQFHCMVERYFLYDYHAPKPDKDIVIEFTDIDGALINRAVVFPINLVCPLYLKKGNDFVILKSDSTALLSSLDYDIEFKEIEGKNYAEFEFVYGDSIEFFVNAEDISKLNYSREGYSLTLPYDSDSFGGTAEGFTAADKITLEEDGYAFYQDETGGVFVKITQKIIDNIEYSIILQD